MIASWSSVPGYRHPCGRGPGRTQTDSAPASPLRCCRGSRPQLSSHLIALMQYKTQVCTSSGIDTPGNRSSKDFLWNAKAISRESHDAVGPPLVFYRPSMGKRLAFVHQDTIDLPCAHTNEGDW